MTIRDIFPAALAGAPCRASSLCGISCRPRLFGIKLGVLFTEAVNTASRVKEALLAGVKGMASGAHFHVHMFALGGEHAFFVAASAGDSGIEHFGMNIFFHGSYLMERGIIRQKPCQTPARFSLGAKVYRTRANHIALLSAFGKRQDGQEHAGRSRKVGRPRPPGQTGT